MKNPITITIASWLASCILILLLAFGSLYFTEDIIFSIMGFGVYIQAILCYIIFITCSIIWREHIDNKVSYFSFFLFMTLYFILGISPFIAKLYFFYIQQ